MSKTQSLEIECDNAAISGTRNQRVVVAMDSPADIDDVITQISDDDLIQWIARNKSPDDIFSSTDLAKWAESEGYAKE